MPLILVLSQPELVPLLEIGECVILKTNLLQMPVHKMYKKGFGLIEVIVSIVLIVLTITGLVHLFLAGKRLLFLSHARMAGGELGKLFLDPLQMDVREDTWGSVNNCLSSNPTVNCLQNASVGNITYNATYNITNVLETSNRLRRVKVDISWSETLPP